MTKPSSRISSEIPFDQEGKHLGFLRLPHSIHRSAYGWIPIPVASIKNGKGPTVLLMAGNHGDEYEGQIGLSTLLRMLDVKDVQGQIIFLPSANFPAAAAGMRTSPIDEGNLNRLFPGDPNGTVTQQMAWYIENVLLAQVDYVFDLHSGGSSLMYIPSAGCRRSDDPKRMDQALEIVRLFGAPAAYVLDSQSSDACTLAAAAARQNVIHYGAELGGGGTLSPQALRVTIDGIRRVLKHLGVLSQAIKVDEPSPTTVSCTTTSNVGRVPLAAVTSNCITNSLAADKPLTAVPVTVSVRAADANSVTVLAGILACCISLMHFLLLRC